MWAWFLAHTNTTRCSFSCLSTARLATPSNYFNHAFILPPACSTQSWNSPGNYSKIRWEAELKHESSGGHCAGLCRFPARWGHLPVPHFSGLLHSLIQIIWRTHVWTEKEVTLCFSCAERTYSKQHHHILIHCTGCELILFVDKSTSQRNEEREEGTGGCLMNTKTILYLW